LAQASDRGVERTCGTCSLCCKLLGIGEIDKAPGVWCSKCDPPNGCTIYDSRPAECREFSCIWLETPTLGEEWKPTRSKMVLYWIDNGDRLIVHVNPGSPDAWRKQPYYDQIKSWARRGIRTGPKVVIRIDSRLIAVLPDRDVDLGRAAKGDGIYIGEVMTAKGPRFIARRIPAENLTATQKANEPGK
jgi:hypothetical protein